MITQEGNEACTFDSPLSKFVEENVALGNLRCSCCGISGGIPSPVRYWCTLLVKAPIRVSMASLQEAQVEAL